MATALETASLVMVPSGYGDGTLGSLQPLGGTGDFTFTRGSNISATRVNEDGYIEKAYENLLLQSNSFTTSPWISSGYSLTDSQAGYDGTNDAWLLDKLTTNNDYLKQLNISNNGVVTVSAYIKAGTATHIMIYTNAVGYGVFELSTDSSAGNLSFTVGTVISGNVEEVGDGWSKYSLTINSTTLFYIKPTDAAGANVIGSIYIQDFQINQGLAAYPYIETATAAVKGGILEDMPRLDYSSGGCSLLLEPERTNLVPQSEYFGAWTAPNSTQTLINDTNPVDGVSYEIESSVTGSSSRIYQNSLMTSGNDYSSSYLVKPSANPPEYIGFACISNLTPDVLYNFATDSFEDFNIAGNAAKCESISMTNGWKLLKVPVHENVSNTRFNIYQGSKVGNALRGTTGQSYYLKFAQLEQASYPTSYIPTYGVSQTRLLDVLDGAGNTDTFNDSEGVLFLDVENVNATSAVSISDNSTSDFIQIYLGYTSLNPIRYRASSGGTSQFDVPFVDSLDVSQPFKVAYRYSANNFSIWINGVKADEVLSGSTPVGLSTIEFYNIFGAGNKFDGKLNQALYFPTALSDEACIELTTI
jgi:hypothetical protein